MGVSQHIVEQTIAAYKDGAFPMSEQGILGFYTCDPRSILFFDQFHIPKRLKRIAKQNLFTFKTDTSFELVVHNCRIGREEWISDQLVEIYLSMHKQGITHSFEAWQDGQLCGGIYGTQLGAAFLAESMFHTVTHASNLCLVYMMEYLENSGFHFCDIQYANPHTERFGPVSVRQDQFKRMLDQAISTPLAPIGQTIS